MLLKRQNSTVQDKYQFSLDVFVCFLTYVMVDLKPKLTF